MPKLILCNEAGCNALSDERYCPKHRNKVKEKRIYNGVKPFEKAKRANEELYNTVRWRKLRAETLERDGFRCCRCGELFAYGLEVHHRIPPRGDEQLFFDPLNLETICVSCHRIETGKEIRARKL